MPTSDFHQISDVLHVVEQIRPRTVLDIGVGFGKWGMLCREILEVYQGRYHRADWAVRLDGIEIYEPYRNALWEFAYDQVYIGDVRKVIASLGRYDLILCCDVIEHLSQADGRALLEQLLTLATYVIVTSPLGFHPQGAHFDNLSETHLSGWTQTSFAGLPHRYKEIGFTFMAVFASDARLLSALNIRRPLDVLGVKKGFVELLRLGVVRLRLRLGLADHGA